MRVQPETSKAPAADDFVIDQGWAGYGAEDHAIWRRLFERQSKLLPGRACQDYLDGFAKLGVAADGIPDFERLSDVLDRATGWRIVAVQGLVPDSVFFQHLAQRGCDGRRSYLKTAPAVDRLQFGRSAACRLDRVWSSRPEWADFFRESTRVSRLVRARWSLEAHGSVSLP